MSKAFERVEAEKVLLEKDLEKRWAAEELDKAGFHAHHVFVYRLRHLAVVVYGKQMSKCVECVKHSRHTRTKRLVRTS